jgi:hypothetical protein
LCEKLRHAAHETHFVGADSKNARFGGNIIQEASLGGWANFGQRALDTAIAEINEKTDLNISVESLGRSKHRRVTTLSFGLKAQVVPNGD